MHTVRQVGMSIGEILYQLGSAEAWKNASLPFNFLISSHMMSIVCRGHWKGGRALQDLEQFRVKLTFDLHKHDRHYWLLRWVGELATAWQMEISAKV